MAEVFRARCSALGGFERDVAVKVLLPEFASESEFVDMLLDEARIAGAIVHPCVVQVTRRRPPGRFVLSGDGVRATAPTCGRSLAQAPGAVPLPTALYVVGEVLRGLHAVHIAVDASGVPRRSSIATCRRPTCSSTSAAW